MGDKRVIILIFLIGLIGWASAWADNSSLYQEVDGCNLINTSNATYVLTQNVSSNGTCFTIYEENITLDCNGFWINYSIDGISNDYGIYINSHSNLTLKNCNIVDGNWESENTTRHGIYIVGSSNNNKLLNNYFYVNNSYGIYISSALYNNLTNNVIFSNTSMGIRLLNAHNSFLMDNFVSTNSQYGIYFGSNNNILKNNYVETVGPAYYLTDSNNNTLENNIGISTESNTAIRLGITNSTIINNTGESDSGYGFSLSSCSNNVFINNTATSNSSTGINIGQSVNNTFYRTIAKNIVGYHAIVFFSSNNTIFRDCINVSGGTYDVDYNSGTINVNNTFINCSYDTSKESAGGSQSELIRKWYYQAYVNYTNGTEASGVDVSGYNTTGQLQFNSLTNSSGWISIQELTEYVNIGGTRTYYNNYSINATLSGYENESNVLNFTVQQNKLDDWFSLEEEEAENVSKFVSIWDTRALSSGSSNATQITLPLELQGQYNFTVYWGDGQNSTITSWDSVNKTHNYDSEGVYTVNITGTIQGWRINNQGDRLKLLEIQQWGPLNLGNNHGYFFAGANNLQITATDVPNLTEVEMFIYAFFECFNLTDIPNMNSWNMREVQEMQGMFYYASSFNGNISGWNTSNVFDMSEMFHGASSFNGNISNWDTSKVVDMQGMFYNANNFNQSLENWDTGNVSDMGQMFQYAYSFNQNLSDWNTSNVTTMQQMFFSATTFNGNISNWDTSNVEHMYNMFYQASSFNQSIGNWNTSKVTSFNGIFYGASDFNQDISNWDASNVSSMRYLFYLASDFNQDISNWNTSKVTDMSYTFQGAADFNQPIGSWDTRNVEDFYKMFTGAATFNQNLSDWNTSKVTDMYQMFFDANNFDGNITNWDTSKVTDMGEMFHNAYVFNQSIGNWDTSNVTNMMNMFNSAYVFNKPIGDWDTSKVTDMSGMFVFADAFNQPLGSWDTGNVSDMGYMFYGANNFNQNLSSWNISNVSDMDSMFHSTTLSTPNYDSLLISWSSQNVQSNIIFHAGYAKYSNCSVNNATAARAVLTDIYNWTITDGGFNASYVCSVVGENMCGILNNSNTVYTLTSNVSSQGTCFTIDGENITLDCDGYWINYSILGEEDTYGVYSELYNNNITIKNCNVIDGNWTSNVFLREGIYLVGTENSTVTNNFVNASNGIGIHLDYSDFNNITNNTLVSYNAEGMTLFYSDFNNVTNNKVDLYNSTYSLSLGISHNNILLNNNVTNYATTNGFAIYVESCSNNTLIDNLGTSYNNYNGIHVYNSPNTTLINNTGTSSTGAGISLSSSSDCFLINNTAISDSYRALSISSSLNTIIYFQTARTTGTSGTRTGIFLYGANNSVIKDCVNISGGTYDIGHNSGQPTINNTFINCSYNINKEYVSSTNELTRKWYYQAYVNYTNGTEVAGANISAYNSTGGLQFSALSDSLGDIERQEVIEYVNIGGTRSYYNDYIINANKSGTANDTNTFNFTATQNKLDDFFTLGIVGEDACGTLDETGQTYTLTSNVSSQGTCFTIAAQNITLDCNGSWINYSIGGGDGNYGVYTNQFNSTVKNCNIVDGNSSSPGYNRFGIFLNLNSNQESEIINNKIYSKDHSIYLLESKGNLLENNTCESSYSGIYLYSSSNNTLKNNFGKGLNSEGINIYSNSLNNTLINNTGESLTHSGIYVASQSNQTNLINNLGSSNSSSGIHIYNSFYNNFTNNTAISNYSYALYIVGSGYNNFIEQNAQGIYPGSAGVYIINSEKDIYFRDCVNISGYTDNFMVVGKVTLVNCSYNPYNDYFYYGLLTRKWYYQAYVNYTNGTEASGVDVSVYNSTDDMQFSALSDSFGLIERQEVTEYIRENNTWNYYNNYSINASLTGYSVDSNELNFSLVQNKIDDWFSLEDLIAPSYSSISHNTTTVGTAVEFSLNIDDSLSLDPNGQYIFSTNNSGEWVNDTAVNFSSTPSWANVSETLNSTVGMIVGYMWYFNDSVGNENSTSVYVLTTTAVPVGEEEEDDDDGGGGGGSSDEDETIILKPSYTQIQEGYETAVSEGYMIQFNFSDKGQYLMEVQDINRFTGNISFSVNGTTYYVDLNESVKINLDNDSYYDLEASVELITFYNSSRMTFKEIHQEIPLSEKPNVTENALNENSNETFSQENQDVVNDEQNKKTLYVVVISAIIISVLGISTVVFIRLKKHKKHKSKK